MQERKIDLLSKKENLVCMGNKKAKFVCCNEKCRQNCLLCGEVDCKCFSKHQNNCKMYFLDLLLKGIQKQSYSSEKEIDEWQNSIQQIIKIYDNIIDELSKKRSEYENYLKYFGLHYNSYIFVETIQEDAISNFDKIITGELIGKILHEIQLPDQIIKPFSKKQLQFFKNQTNRQFDTLLGQLNNFHIGNIKRFERVQSLSLSPEYEVKLHKIFNWRISKIQLLHRFGEMNIEEIYQDLSKKINLLIILQLNSGETIGLFQPVGSKNSLIFSLTKDKQVQFENIDFLYSKENLRLATNQQISPNNIDINTFLTNALKQSQHNDNIAIFNNGTFGNTGINVGNNGLIVANNGLIIGNNAPFGNNRAITNNGLVVNGPFGNNGPLVVNNGVLANNGAMFGNNGPFGNNEVIISNSPFSRQLPNRPSNRNIFQIVNQWKQCICKELFGNNDIQKIASIATFELRISPN